MSRVTRSSTCCSMPAAAHLFIYFLAVCYIYLPSVLAIYISLCLEIFFILQDSPLAAADCNRAQRHMFSRCHMPEDISEACHCLLRQAIHQSEAILRNLAIRSCIALLHEPFSNPANSGCFIKSASGHRSCPAGTPLLVLTP